MRPFTPKMDNAEELADALTFTNRVLGYLSAPVLMQHVITPARVRVNLAEYQERRDMFYDAEVLRLLIVLRPQGAYYLFPQNAGERRHLYAGASPKKACW